MAVTTVVVLYRMNGCGHCESLMPTWQELAQEIKAPSLKILDIETAETETQIRSKLSGVDSKIVDKVIEEKTKVHGFPSMQKITANSAKEFDGSREKSAILQWIQSSSSGGGRRKKTRKTKRRKTRRVTRRRRRATRRRK